MWFISCTFSYLLAFVSGSRNVWSLQDIGTHDKTKTVETYITLTTGSSVLQHYSVSGAGDTCVSRGNGDPLVLWRQRPNILHLIQLMYFHKSFHCAISCTSPSDEGFYLINTCLLIHESPGTTSNTSERVSVWTEMCRSWSLSSTSPPTPPFFFELHELMLNKGQLVHVFFCIFSLKHVYLYMFICEKKKETWFLFNILL